MAGLSHHAMKGTPMKPTRMTLATAIFAMLIVSPFATAQDLEPLPSDAPAGLQTEDETTAPENPPTEVVIVTARGFEEKPGETGRNISVVSEERITQKGG